MNNLRTELKHLSTSHSNPIGDFPYHQMSLKKNTDSLSNQYSNFLNLYNQYAYLGHFFGNNNNGNNSTKSESKKVNLSSKHSFHINQLCPELFAEGGSKKEVCPFSFHSYQI